MRFPRPPDWILYAGVVAAMAVVAVAKQEHAYAPPAPPPIDEEGGLAAGAIRASPLQRLAPQGRERAVGTAFSVSEAGVWLTARHVVNGCQRTAVLVSARRGVQARVSAGQAGDVAVLSTQGGAAPLPLAPGDELTSGRRAYLPGFPQAAPGEVAARFVGRFRLRRASRDEPAQPVLAWAEVGRTDGLKGDLSGLSGAPVLDEAGRVLGVTLAYSPRRGRIYSATPEAIRTALASASVRPSGLAEGGPVNRGNYGRAADALRRNLRVAPVACLD
jgi:S1-C subfamily serine protease